MSLYLITTVLDLLGLNYVCENQKSINELAREIERLLDKACASLPAKAREMQRYATTSMLCQKNCSPVEIVNYPETISKAREFLPLFQQVNVATNIVNQVQPRNNENCLKG